MISALASLPRRMRAAGVLGINRRNAHYIFQYNPRHLYPLVDDKLKTKALARTHGMPAPELYGVIERHGDLRDLERRLAPYSDFVIKPVHGAMGNGVLVVTGRQGERFVKASGVSLDLTDIRYYVTGILSGLYSLGGHPDAAMIESRIRIDPVFERIAFGGVPDIRVIVFRGVPVLSMLRLPTRASDGRANLHQGAIAAGIDLATGRTHHAVFRSRLIEDHPDTGHSVLGVTVPHWRQILQMAALSHDMTGLGYIGVDVVLDREHGPMLLELNARPGLAIQIANFQGLLPVLEAVEALDLTGKTPADRVAIARELAARRTPRRPAEAA